jgi:hypothetical protein
MVERVVGSNDDGQIDHLAPSNAGIAGVVLVHVEDVVRDFSQVHSGNVEAPICPSTIDTLAQERFTAL